MGILTTLRRLFLWGPALLDATRDFVALLKVCHASLTQLHDVMAHAEDGTWKLVELVKELREDARAELSLAERERRDARKSEERMRRMLREIREGEAPDDDDQEEEDIDPQQIGLPLGTGSTQEAILADFVRRHPRPPSTE